MPRRGENIHKRKDGRWEGRYKNGTNCSGKTIYSSVYGKTYGEVKSKLENVKTKNNSTNTKYKDCQFKEVLSLWNNANQVKHKKSTQLKYDYLIEKHINPYLGDYKISNLNSFVLNNFMVNKLQNGRVNKSGGLSAAYVRSIMLIIFSAIQFAVNEHMCDPIIITASKPAIERKEVKILSNEDQIRLERALLINMDTTKLGIFISLRLGLRIGEVCALCWSDIDFNNRIVHVRATISRVKDQNNNKNHSTMLVIEDPKTRSSIRDIPIPTDLFNVLLSMRASSVSQFVVSNTKSFISPRTFEYRYHKVLNACGVAPINFHALRHTFATRCIELGVDTKTLSEILGHSNVSITLNTYVHSSIEHKRVQIEKLSNLSA